MSEITFYEDSEYAGNMSKLDRSNLKLDFNNASAISAVKRNNILAAGTPSNSTLLQSPDLMLLKLGSPELENMIMQSGGFITTTPTPTDSRTPDKKVTEEQEQFAAGFVLALQKLQQSGETEPTVSRIQTATYSNQNVNRPTTNTNNKLTFSSYDVNGNVSVKQEIPDSNVVVTAGLSNVAYHGTQSCAVQAKGRQISGLSNGLSNTRFQGQPSTVQDLRPTSIYSQEQSHTQRLRHPNDGRLTVVRHGQTKTGLIRQVPASSNGAMPGSVSSVPNQARNVTAGTYPVISAVGSVGQVGGQPQIFKIEDEAQIVPSNTPPLQSRPIDLKMQEIIKHERKKLRNRLAAQRCRKRKIEREDELKVKVKELKTENNELTNTRSELAKLVIELKQKVMDHVNEGCHVYLPNSQVAVTSMDEAPFSLS